MKRNKSLPLIALSALVLAGCPANQETSTGNALLDALNKIQVGNVKKKVVDKLFRADVITASDSDIKKAKYQEDLFMPYWWYGDSYEEDFYKENVKKSSHITEYEVYDNEVVHMTDSSEVYGYDPSTIDIEKGEDDGISATPLDILGEAFIYHDMSDETLNYTYTRDGSPENAYSFNGKREYDDYIFNEVVHKGGLGTYIAQAKEDVEDTFNSFAAQVSDWDRVEEFKATKNEDGSFSLVFTGDLCMPLYSGELVWGYNHGKDEEGEDDYNQPTSKKTTQYDNIFVNRAIRCHYEFNISKDAVVTYGEATYLCYHTQILKDPMIDTLKEIEKTNPDYEDDEEYQRIRDEVLVTVANGRATYPLTKEITRELKERLIVPEYLDYRWEGKDWHTANSYADPSYKYDTQLPYNTDYFEGSKERLGNYQGELPNKSEYRRLRDQVDKGIDFWVNAYNLIKKPS